ncbi:MAG: glycoside hydrolase family 57 protein [Gemmatales bacterium]|nr:glycoside hydrolase family 57 protein [Gemmatales bacterium]MDW7995915.1 glycoside hydrolase family 57 protein [Gemmatales bacterium]
MAEVAVALIWHMHQPWYRDDVAGETLLPWVRLHGVKSYYGMALHLQEVPEMRCTVNFVPCLVEQLRLYVEHNYTDRFLEITQIPAAELSEEQALFLLNNFFHANPQQMIFPYPRYRELYTRRAWGKLSAEQVLRRFQESDFRDLQVWFNLTWIHPLVVDQDPDLKELIRKGRFFSESDKLLVISRHRDILSRILPLYRRLAESGQIELTTTPYYHPILPLLLDKRLARETMPEVRLPRFLTPYHEDAHWHVRAAVQYHQSVFGRAPTGMWPAEGSVCQSMLPLLAEHGIQWIATDEQVLSVSTHGLVGRDSRGFVRNPEQLYQPYWVQEGQARLAILFRDHALSDLIGFHYQRSDGQEAAQDFLEKLQGIARAVSDSRSALVPVILDGENCWEYYPGGGVAFLRALYQLCTTTPGIEPVCVTDYLQRHPPRNTLPHLVAGSWINANFDIWIGHDEDNLAWDLLHQTREFARRYLEQNQLPEETARRVWREIYIAEGSDWFWWYGPHHSTPQDVVFDYLFRKHLQNVYILLGVPPPPQLAQRIRRRALRPIHTQPTSFVEVRVDGRGRPLEWLGAGHYSIHQERGTMVMMTSGPITEMYFGFTPETLFLRIDFEGASSQVLPAYDRLRIRFAEPEGYEIEVWQPGSSQPRVRFLRNNQELPSDAIQFAQFQIAELAIPFDLLGVAADQPVAFYVELMQGNQSRDRAPRDSTIQLQRPSPDFERINWDV